MIPTRFWTKIQTRQGALLCAVIAAMLLLMDTSFNERARMTVSTQYPSPVRIAYNTADAVHMYTQNKMVPMFGPTPGSLGA